jgi:dipeptidyl aminopeptidase/acylaminoacyl peptidase
MQIASRVLLLAAFSAVPFAASAQQAPRALRPITIDDQFQIREVEGPRLSPDAQWVAYTVRSTSLKEDKSEQRIWMVPFAGGDAIPLTAEGVSSRHPRWSPDGRYLAFLSARDEGKTQIWLLNRVGGEAQRLTETPQDVDSFVWSPDGKRLCLILRDATAEELQAAKDKDKDKDKDRDDKSPKEKKPKTQKPWAIDRLQFKADEVGYLDRRRTHLYVFDVAEKRLTQITSGDFDDSGAVWSPDGKQLAFSSNRTSDADRNYNTDVWTVSADNTDKGAHLTQITTNPGEDRSPVWVARR